MSRKPSRLPEIVGALAIAAALGVPSVSAHEGEDHSDPASAATSVADPATSFGVDAALPRRESDGAVFLPKPTQYRIGVRTRLVEAATIPLTVELVGKVVAEPNAGGRVQSTQTGRIEAGPKGLPVLGQRVRKGDVLAFVEPSIASLERANRQSELAALDAQLAIARSKAARYEQLDGAVPRKDIIEDGNFAAETAIAMIELWGAAANDLAGRSAIAVATLTAPLRRIFTRIGVPIVEIAPARPEALGAAAAEWGRYYETDPRVCAGIIREGQAAISAFLARRNRREAA